MQQVDRRLAQVLKHENPLVERVSEYMLNASGKRLRPALVLLSGLFGSAPRATMIQVGAAVEMIHMATLVHDDVIDEADLRRGLPAVRTQFSNPVAVLAGDYLFATAFEMFAETGSTEIVSAAARVVHVICSGEIAQNLDRGRVATEEDYWRRVEAKTGFFLEMSCRMGAMASGADTKTVAVLSRYGHHIGLAYQVVDDLLDWVADPGKLGKAVGEDVAIGIYTLPIIHALSQEAYREPLQDLLQGVDRAGSIDAIRRILGDSGSIGYARGQAESHIERALEEADRLPGGEAKEALKELAKFIVARDY